MEKKIKFIYILIISFIVVGIYIVGYTIGVNKHQKNDLNKIEQIDTVYNTIVLDSIKYNIYVKDSVIKKLKVVVNYEIEQAINNNDSDAIKQFYYLAGASE